MTWHVEVPITASMWPGSTARAAGAVTCASTFPTETAIPAGSPRWRAASGVRSPARAPSGDSGHASSLRDEVDEVGVERAEVRLGRVRPSWKSPL